MPPASKPGPARRGRRATPTDPAELLRDESGDNDVREGLLRVAVGYPNSYRAGMAALGFHHVRRMLQDAGPVRVERFFLGDGAPRCLESPDPLGRFDVLAFSVSYELDFLGVLQTLEGAGLTLEASRRGPRDPLVIAGGPAVCINPHALYPFVDLVALGEAEVLVPPIVSALLEQGESRLRALEELDAAAGLHVTAGAWRAAGGESRDCFRPDVQAAPSADWEGLEASLERGDLAGDPRLARPPEAAPPIATLAAPPTSRIVTPHAEFGRRVLVEIARGCPHGCGFCWLGGREGGFRPFEVDAILDAVDEACAETACADVGLIASAVGAHPGAEALCEGLLARGRRLSFSSLRADELTGFLLDALVRSGQQGFTLAPETGREEARRRLGKPIADAVFFEAVENARRVGLRDIKFYFMVGLPRETDEDMEAIGVFLQRAAALAGGRVSAGIGVYTPKPGAPLTRHAAPEMDVVRRRLSRLMKSLGRLPGVRASAASPDLAAAQAILANEGFGAAAFLREVLASGGRWRDVVRRRLRAAE